MDFSHLSLIQTKKQEMDSQVGLLELFYYKDFPNTKEINFNID